MKQEKMALSLESDAFNSLKMDFDQVLRRILYTMLQKEGEKAELKLSLKITLEKDLAPDLENHTYAADRNIIVPKFEHKITSVMQYKDEVSGLVGGEYELVWDWESGDYIMQPIQDAQSSLWEGD